MVRWRIGGGWRKENETGAFAVMMDWVSVWWGLSHSPYVTCFTSASAVRISDQSAPAEGLGVLNCTGFFPLCCSFTYQSPTSVFFRYLCHIWENVGRRRMLKACLLRTRTHRRSHTNRTPSYTCHLCGFTFAPATWSASPPSPSI